MAAPHPYRGNMAVNWEGRIVSGFIGEERFAAMVVYGPRSTRVAAMVRRPSRATARTHTTNRIGVLDEARGMALADGWMGDCSYRAGFASAFRSANLF